MQAIDPTTHTPAIPPLKVGSFALRSRLVVGTGKYRDFEQTRAAIEASGADAVTVAVRRERLYDAQGRSLLDALPLDRLTVLPNTARSKAEMELPSRTKLDTDKELPMVTQSIAEFAYIEPALMIPAVVKLLPSRTNVLTDKELPIFTSFLTERLPYTAKSDRTLV